VSLTKTGTEVEKRLVVGYSYYRCRQGSQFEYCR
jgi:hypothetical protein